MPEKVLVTREIPAAGLRALEPFDVRILHERPPEREELLDAVRGVSGVLSTATEKVDGELMDAAGEDLRVVANMAVGYDNVDVEAGRESAYCAPNVGSGGVRSSSWAETCGARCSASLALAGSGKPSPAARKASAWRFCTTTAPGKRKLSKRSEPATWTSTNCWSPRTSSRCTPRSPARPTISSGRRSWEG